MWVKRTNPPSFDYVPCALLGDFVLCIVEREVVQAGRRVWSDSTAGASFAEAAQVCSPMLNP